MTLKELKEALEMISFKDNYEVIFTNRNDEEFSIKSIKVSSISHLVSLEERDIGE